MAAFHFPVRVIPNAAFESDLKFQNLKLNSYFSRRFVIRRFRSPVDLVVVVASENWLSVDVVCVYVSISVSFAKVNKK